MFKIQIKLRGDWTELGQLGRGVTLYETEADATNALEGFLWMAHGNRRNIRVVAV